MCKELIINNYGVELTITDLAITINTVDGEMEFAFSGNSKGKIRDFFNYFYVNNYIPDIPKETKRYAVSLVYLKGTKIHIESHIINAISRIDALGQGLIKFPEEKKEYVFRNFSILKID